MEEISRGLLETIESLFEVKDFNSFTTIETSRLMDIYGFSDPSMDESSCDVALDRDQVQFYGQNYNNAGMVQAWVAKKLGNVTF